MDEFFKPFRFPMVTGVWEERTSRMPIMTLEAGNSVNSAEIRFGGEFIDKFNEFNLILIPSVTQPVRLCRGSVTGTKIRPL